MKWVRDLVLRVSRRGPDGDVFLGRSLLRLRHDIPDTERQNRTIDGNPKTALGLPYEDVSSKPKEERTLRGWFLPAARGCGLVTVHGLGANRLEFLHEAKCPRRWLRGLMFDCRGHG